MVLINILYLGNGCLAIKTNMGKWIKYKNQRLQMVYSKLTPTAKLSHIYSSIEASKCLSGAVVYVSGDSYMVQLFIGLIDILLNDPSNDELKKGVVRTEVLQERISTLSHHFKNSSK